MSNPLQIVSKSAYLDEKAKAIFQALLADFRQGRIKSKTELAYQVYRALMDFHAQIGKPTMTVREAGGPPASSDYNAMMHEIHMDLGTLFAELKLMSGAIGESFGYVETERQALTETVRRTTDRMQALQEAAAATGQVFGDSFINRARFDQEMVEGTPAEISQSANALILGLLDSAEVREGVTITITPTSNGFPGNTHQVKPGDGFYRFAGEEHMHLDLQAVLDGNADTWLEYETIAVSERVIEETGGLGFSYHEGQSWLKAGNEPLRLELRLELDKPRTLNWLTLTPFLPAEKGAGPARVTGLLLEDGKGLQVEVADQAPLAEERVFLFPKMKVKRVTVRLEQSTAYDILAGHLFFKELERTQGTVFESSRQQPGKRVDGPKPSLENLGLRYDPSTQTVELPSAKADEAAPDRTDAAARLFTAPETDERVQAGIEAVPARRYAVGVRDIGMASYRFAPESTYISQPLKAGAPIRRIALEAVDSVPVEFGDGDWVTYAFTADGGKTWHEIHPEGTLSAGAKTEYLIGSRTPAPGRQAHIGYIEPEAPVSEVRLMIRLKRPDVTKLPDADYFTPVVYDYRLHVETGEVNG